MNGSRVTLVPYDQRAASTSTGVVEAKTLAEAGRSYEDIELGLAPHQIGVPRDVDVSRR